LLSIRPKVGDTIGSNPSEAHLGVWVDLLEPSREEELAVEACLGLSLPTREDMNEIEASSRLYHEDDAAFMTAQIAYFGGQSMLQSGPITFVLNRERLVTIRYIVPASFDIFAEQLKKQPSLLNSGAQVFNGLLDVLIDRTADLIEKTSGSVDSLSKKVFTRHRRERLEDILLNLGDYQNDIAKIRDSLVSFSRLLVFAANVEDKQIGLEGRALKDFRDDLKTMSHDVTSLSDHVTYVSGNIAFLLEAALGLINIEQNNIVRLISITSVIFLPLTLIASIYGMNFDALPGLHDARAFWSVCAVMVVIAGSLLAYFKWKRWF
jgi:magnesium transporter